MACLLGILLQAPVASAQNLAQNPGFETGNTSDWFPFGPTTISAQSAQVHSGNYAALVEDRTNTWNGIAQSMLDVIQPGVPCDLSIWVRMASGGSETVKLTIAKTDSSGTSYPQIASSSVSSFGWTQLSGQYTLDVSGTLDSLTLYVELANNATADFYVDDLVVLQDLSGPSGEDGESTLFWDDVHQQIDGFGASSAWRSTWTTALANMFFSTNSGTGYSSGGSPYSYNGIGLSLLRTRIAPGATTVEQSIMQMARDRGARVWSAPWSPEAQFKSNGNVNGGSFVGNAANYQAYANQLAGYVVNMKNQYGVDIYALSVQNEPDANVTTYESCKWTAQQIHDFIPYLSGALAANNVGATKILLPESQNWTDPQGLHSIAMNDPGVAALVGVIANHNYVADNANGDQSTPAAINSYGKALWETEVSLLSGSDSSIDNGLYWAGRVHLFLTAAQANAWHYWWLCAYGTGNEGLCDDNDVPAKRMYTLGNFSRFVRPGFHRIGTTDTGTSLISAYKDLTNGTFAVVAINAATNAVTQTFDLNGFDASSVTPWITSATLSLVNQAAVTVSNQSFVYSLPAKSVATFVGQAVLAPTNSAPTDITLSNSTVAENQPVNTAVGVLSTTDPDSGDTFTYSLVGGTGSADNGSFNVSGDSLRTSASFDYELQNSFSIRVRTTDQGALYHEEIFAISVTNVNEAPMLSPVGDETMNAGATLVVTNSATDPDVPAQALTFSLLSVTPTNATLNPSNGVFSWRPLVSQSDTTNLITVQVTDDGAPPLTATNSFDVIVHPLMQPNLSSIQEVGGQMVLSVTGALGPDYTLLTSTNLLNWQPLITTNPTTMPFAITDPDPADAARFYLIELGP